MWGWFRFLGKADSPRHLEVGRWGESLAETYLRKQGFRIRGRRVRVGRRDEIDLIAQEGEQLVFVEVKTRRNEAFGRPASAVNRAKRRHASRAAVRYLQKMRNPRVRFRFDIVEVVGSPENPNAVTLRHIRNAFVLDRRYMLP